MQMSIYSQRQFKQDYKDLEAADKARQRARLKGVYQVDNPAWFSSISQGYCRSQEKKPSGIETGSSLPYFGNSTKHSTLTLLNWEKNLSMCILHMQTESPLSSVATKRYSSPDFPPPAASLPIKFQKMQGSCVYLPSWLLHCSVVLSAACLSPLPHC